MRRLVYYLDAVGYGGAVRYVERLVRGIDPAEFAVTMVCPSGDAFGPLRDALAELPVRFVDVATEPSLKQATYAAGTGLRRRAGPLAGLARVPGARLLAKTALGLVGVAEESRRQGDVRARLRECRPDVLHVNLDRFPDATGKLALLLGREAGAARVVATLHCQPQPPVSPRFIHHFYDRQALRAADRLVVVSAGQGRKLESWYGADASRIQEIPNGAPADCFAERPSRLDRAALGFAPADVLVAHVGSVYRQRGQLVLAEALASLHASCPRLRAALVGGVMDPEYAAKLDERLAGVPTQPFRRLGHRPDAVEIVRAADIAVVSSFEEGHSLALLEAMALGKPIVATSIESNAASLGNGEAGLLVPPGDSAALAAAIRALYDDAGLCARLGAAARVRAARLYTEERAIQATLALYQSVSSDPPLVPAA